MIEEEESFLSDWEDPFEQEIQFPTTKNDFSDINRQNNRQTDSKMTIEANFSKGSLQDCSFLSEPFLAELEALDNQNILSPTHKWQIEEPTRSTASKDTLFGEFDSPINSKQFLNIADLEVERDEILRNQFKFRLCGGDRNQKVHQWMNQNFQNEEASFAKKKYIQAFAIFLETWILNSFSRDDIAAKLILIVKRRRLSETWLNNRLGISKAYISNKKSRKIVLAGYLTYILVFIKFKLKDVKILLEM